MRTMCGSSLASAGLIALDAPGIPGGMKIDAGRTIAAGNEIEA
jgi:hypothetical protein